MLPLGLRGLPRSETPRLPGRMDMCRAQLEGEEDCGEATERVVMESIAWFGGVLDGSGHVGRERSSLGCCSRLRGMIFGLIYTERLVWDILAGSAD